MIRLAGWLALVALTGCVVDVDLGQSSGSGADDDARVPVDPLPLDAASPDRALPDLDLPDLDLPDLDLPDRDLPDRDLPDLDPGPDAIAPELGCGECVELLAAGVDCAEGPPCQLDDGRLAECERACGAVDDGTCDGCYTALTAVVSDCRRFAPDEACQELELALFTRCDTRCFDDACAVCLADIAADCRVDAPLECATRISDDFEACLGSCDGPRVIEAVICATDAGEAWSLCTLAAGEACDAFLAAEVDGCRSLAIGDFVECVDTCAGLADIRGAACIDLGGDPDLCAQRAVAADEVCLADCQSRPLGTCIPSSQIRARICDAGGGVDCLDVGQAILDTCTFGAFEEMPCGDCQALALSAYDSCRGAGCADVFEQVVVECLDACGGIAPTAACRPCAREADLRLGDCVIAGFDVMACLATRDQEAAECAFDCGDAIPRAVACRVRADDLFELCDVASPDDACYGAAYAFDMACRWARLGVE